MSDISDVSDVSDISDTMSDISISDVSDISDVEDVVSDVSDVEEVPEVKEEPKKEVAKKEETPKKEVKKVEAKTEKKAEKKTEKKRPGSPRPKKSKKMESDSDDDDLSDDDDDDENEKEESEEEEEDDDEYIEDPDFFPKHKEWADKILAQDFNVVVNDPKTEGNRFQPYTTYKVSTKGQEFEVRRRFSEFDQLYNILTARYPGLLIEPMPPKKVVGNKSNNFVYLRMKDLEHWINNLLSIPYIRADNTVVEFLSTQKINWEKAQAVDTLVNNVVSFIPSDITKAIGIFDGQKKKQRATEKKAKGDSDNDGYNEYNNYLNHIKCPEEIEVVLKSFREKISRLVKTHEKTLSAVKTVISRSYGYSQAAEKMSHCFKNLSQQSLDINYENLKIANELNSKNAVICKSLDHTSTMCNDWYKIIQFMPTTAGKLLIYEMERQLKQTQGLLDLIERRYTYLNDYTDSWHKKDAAMFEIHVQKRKGNRAKLSKAKQALTDIEAEVDRNKKRLNRITKALLKVEVSGYVERKLKDFDMTVGHFAACNVLLCREQEPIWMEFAKYALPDPEQTITEYKTQLEDMKNRTIALDGDFDISPLSDSEDEKEEETKKTPKATAKKTTKAAPKKAAAPKKGKKPAKEESDSSDLSDLSDDSDDMDL
ncbi:hypothetical protein WA158_007823 [Blastocystis sp. Blastoise]